MNISGYGFGASQAGGYAILNNLYGVVSSWSDTQVVVAVQPGTSSGNLYVHQYGVDSNAVAFTSTWASSTPAITSLSPASGIIGDFATINGTGFGAAQN